MVLLTIDRLRHVLLKNLVDISRSCGNHCCIEDLKCKLPIVSVYLYFPMDLEWLTGLNLKFYSLTGWYVR